MKRYKVKNENKSTIPTQILNSMKDDCPWQPTHISNNILSFRHKN